MQVDCKIFDDDINGIKFIVYNNGETEMLVDGVEITSFYNSFHDLLIDKGCGFAF